MDKVVTYFNSWEKFQASCGLRPQTSPLSLIYMTDMWVIFFDHHTWHLLNVQRSPLIKELMLRLEVMLVWEDPKDARCCQISSITASFLQKGQFEELTEKSFLLLQGRMQNFPTACLNCFPKEGFMSFLQWRAALICSTFLLSQNQSCSSSWVSF